MGTTVERNPSTPDNEAAKLADVVQDSYGRCCTSKSFFDDFYEAFVGSSPAIGPKFAKTDMEKQKELLRRGLAFTIMYYKGSTLATQVINGLAKSHSKSQLDIAPSLYAFWLNSLVKTVKKHDKEFTADIERSWRTVMARTIETMTGGY